MADPSLTVAACAHWFGWPWDDWDRLAGATVAGHLIECGTQLTGGIATDWLDTPDVDRIGFPIVEVAADGSCVVTKPRGSGGRVCQQTVKEQLVYEIGDPDAYLSPDVTASLLSLQVDDDGRRTAFGVRGARGRPAPPTYKVSATYQDGFRAQGQLTVFGTDAVAKAQRAGQAVLSRLEADGVSLRRSGRGMSRRRGLPPAGHRSDAWPQQLTETVLRIAVADASREAVERFARELMPLVTAGPPGTTGYAEGRPRVHPLFRFWPCLIERDRVSPHVELLPAAGECKTTSGPAAEGIAPQRLDHVCERRVVQLVQVAATSWTTRPTDVRPPRRLGDIAYARSGDKGINANIGLIARRREDFPRLLREVTAERVAAYFGLSDAGRVTRYELPNLDAINLVVRGILANPLRVDAQGKALAQVLLEMPLQEPR